MLQGISTGNCAQREDLKKRINVVDIKQGVAEIQNFKILQNFMIQCDKPDKQS